MIEVSYPGPIPRPYLPCWLELETAGGHGGVRESRRLLAVIDGSTWGFDVRELLPGRANWRILPGIAGQIVGGRELVHGQNNVKIALADLPGALRLDIAARLEADAGESDAPDLGMDAPEVTRIGFPGYGGFSSRSRHWLAALNGDGQELARIPLELPIDLGGRPRDLAPLAEIVPRWNSRPVFYGVPTASRVVKAGGFAPWLTLEETYRTEDRSGRVIKLATGFPAEGAPRRDLELVFEIQGEFRPQNLQLVFFRHHGSTSNDALGVQIPVRAEDGRSLARCAFDSSEVFLPARVMVWAPERRPSFFELGELMATVDPVEVEFPRGAGGALVGEYSVPLNEALSPEDRYSDAPAAGFDVRWLAPGDDRSRDVIARAGFNGVVEFAIDEPWPFGAEVLQIVRPATNSYIGVRRLRMTEVDKGPSEFDRVPGTGRFWIEQ